MYFGIMMVAQVPNSTRFPAGLKALGDYMHHKGVKFGIYSDEGTKTCGGCELPPPPSRAFHSSCLSFRGFLFDRLQTLVLADPGSEYHELADAKTLAS